MDPKDILTDEREIVAIYPVDGSVGWTTSEQYLRAFPVDKVEPYGEPGEYCALPWFAIWKGGQIIARINAIAIGEVYYAKNKNKSAKEDNYG